MFPNNDSASSFYVYMMDTLCILDLSRPPRHAFTSTLALIAARRPYGGRRLRGARAPYGRRRRLLGPQPACTSPGHIRSWTRSWVAMAGSPSVGTSHAVELSRTPRRRLSRGGLGAQGQVALPARNRRRIASPPAYASPVHPSRRIRCQFVMRAAITVRRTTRIALRAGRRELGAREPIQSGRTPPRSSVFTRYHL
jgi:hypothetical protein